MHNLGYKFVHKIIQLKEGKLKVQSKENQKVDYTSTFKAITPA